MARIAAVLVGLALALGGCGGERALAPPAEGDPEPAATEPAGAGRAARLASAQARARLAAEAEARRRAGLRRLRGSRTVEGALRRALLTRRLTPAAHAALRGQLAAARAAAGRLDGVRRTELAAVLGTVERLAHRRELTAERLAPVFLVLRRNTAFWTRAPLPVPGWRTMFEQDPVVFQYYAGEGLQLQPLASWGRANGLAAACLRSLRAERPDRPCRRRRLAQTLDRLVALGARRGGFLAWEHYFAYGGGAAPWISGMAQATAIQALARGTRALGDPRYARAATRALGAFEQPPPTGVAVRAPGGRHYLMYSFSPGLRILNGDLQAVTGLRDMAALTRSRRARRLFGRGERAARHAVAGFDTGAWSLYSAGGRESTLGYHRLVAGFLGNLCDRTRRAVYCRTRDRFARYEREPPRIRVARTRGLRARTPAAGSFSLSKVSEVSVRVSWRRGSVLRREVSLGRGRHAYAWTPPGRGRYRVRIEAQGPSGPRGVALRTVRVTRDDVATERRHRAQRRARAERRERERERRRRRSARREELRGSSGEGAPGGSAAARAPRATASR